MKLKITLLSLSILFLLSCKDKKETKTVPETKQEVKEEMHDHDKHEDIVSNNGEKWKVAPNMMAHIAKMNTDVVNFKGSELKDYKELSDKLIDSSNLLTSNCTMTGQAHDELHKWLLPYINMLNALSEVKNKENAKIQYEKIDAAFKELNNYFN